MKLSIPNRDIDDPAETKEISSIGLDLECDDDTHSLKQSKFAVQIQGAATNAAKALSKEEEAQKRRDAQAMAEERFREVANEIAAKMGVSVGYEKPWVYKPKKKIAYQLWKRVIPLFLEDPKTLSMGPTSLAKWLAPNEPNYIITRDMFYDKLNEYAIKDLIRLLRQRGITIALKPPVTIRSVQKLLVERNHAIAGTETERFSGDFEVRGSTAYINGKPYAIQLGASGRRRIKWGRSWLPLDALKEICSVAR